MELKKLNEKIKSLGTKTSKWRDEVQLLLVSCAEHAFDHKNVDPCGRIVHATKGADATALIRWIEKHLPAIWVKKEARFRFNKSFKGEFDGITLLAEPWWELAKSPKNISSSIDCLDLVRGLITRIENEIKAGKKTVEHADLVKQLAAVANSYEYPEEDSE